jgi:RHS repeat-associated protein
MNGSTKKITSVTTLVLKAFVLFFFILSHVATAEEIYYYHNDHLGTPQVMTDKNADIVWQADYTPFGKANVVVETITNNIRLPGQYFDKETGLHYNYHRDYDSLGGRYIQSDPIGLAGGINTYGYAYQNPVMNTDPYGLWVPQAIGAFVNMGFEGYNQYQSGNLNLSRLAMAGATGALGGFGSTAIKAIGFGSVAGAINTAYQEVDKVNSGCQDEINTSKIILSSIFGGFGGGFGSSIGTFMKGRYRTSDISVFSDTGVVRVNYGAHGAAAGAAGGGIVGNQ